MSIFIYPKHIFAIGFLARISFQETRLRAERDDKVRLRGQAGIHKRNGEESRAAGAGLRGEGWVLGF